MADEEFITERQEHFTKAFNSYDVDKLMAFYAKDTDFADYGAGVAHLDYPALYTFYTGVYKPCKGMVAVTRAVTGTPSFTAWEWNITFTLASVLEGGDAKEMKAAGFVVGKEIKMVGTSLASWNEEGKVVRGA